MQNCQQTSDGLAVYINILCRKHRQAGLLDFGLGHVSSAATACAEKMRMYNFYDDSEQFTLFLSKEAVVISWSWDIYERLLITQSGWPGPVQGRQKAFLSSPLFTLSLPPGVCSPAPAPSLSPSLLPLFLPLYSCFAWMSSRADEFGFLQKSAAKSNSYCLSFPANFTKQLSVEVQSSIGYVWRIRHSFTHAIRLQKK